MPERACPTPTRSSSGFATRRPCLRTSGRRQGTARSASYSGTTRPSPCWRWRARRTAWSRCAIRRAAFRTRRWSRRTRTSRSRGRCASRSGSTSPSPCSAASTPSRGRCPRTSGSTARPSAGTGTGISNSCPDSRSSPAWSSEPGSTSIRCDPRKRQAACARSVSTDALDAARFGEITEAARRRDRGGEVEALVLGLLDQHDRLERVDVVDALLLALRRDLGLVRPVVELHLRDPGDLTDLAQVELDLVEVLGQVDRLEEVSCLVV